MYFFYYFTLFFCWVFILCFCFFWFFFFFTLQHTQIYHDVNAELNRFVQITWNLPQRLPKRTSVFNFEKTGIIYIYTYFLDIVGTFFLLFIMVKKAGQHRKNYIKPLKKQKKKAGTFPTRES